VPSAWSDSAAERSKRRVRVCKYMLGALSQVLTQLVAEGYLASNVAELVDGSLGAPRRLNSMTFLGTPSALSRQSARNHHLLKSSSQSVAESGESFDLVEGRIIAPSWRLRAEPSRSR
jgi:hypothetical protein